MTTMLVTCGILHHEDTAVLINNIPCLLFGPLEQTHNTKCHLDQKKLTNTFILLRTWASLPYIHVSLPVVLFPTKSAFDSLL
jgi:hypothetical protein